MFVAVDTKYCTYLYIVPSKYNFFAASDKTILQNINCVLLRSLLRIVTLTLIAWSQLW